MADQGVNLINLLALLAIGAEKDGPLATLKESDEFLCKLVADEHSRDWLKWLIHRAEVIGERLDRGPEELE